MKFLLITILTLLSASLAEEFQALKDYSSGYNQFTSNVYKELLKSHSGNFVLSPLSIDIVLSLMATGAKGNTAKELISTLHLPEANHKIYEIFKDVTDRLRYDTVGSTNKVYIKDGFKISDEFKRAAVGVFDADVQSIDFEKTSQAADEINSWISQRTEGKINNLISPAVFDSDTRAVLINALIFKDFWWTYFKFKNTKKREFKVNSAKKIEVMSMKQSGIFNYYESSQLNARFLEIPYARGDISMHVVLPNDVDGLSALENELLGAFTPPEYQKEKIEVILPKMKIESDIDFVPILRAMGIKKAFRSSANFRGIAEDRSGLKISKVIQKAVIEVDEEQTFAAAASGVIAAIATSGDTHFSQYIPFHADHPFLFYIRLNKLGINLFVGRYVSDV